ncbi:anthrone oxygenase family protein [Roseateles sp. NT4]|uniref:anthrone oxygenase family protein n=1 Tax=Roseateles sp. NT4 TaxID=3453715 RepID=UPI003EED0770
MNEVILNRTFLSAFVGTALLALAAAGLGWAQAPRGVAALLAAGALAYAVGVFGVTVALNVPMNETLARLAADSAAGQDYWRVYLRDWVFWNGVRAMAGGVSGACLLVAALVGR